MSNEYGFFASKDHDRRYSADDFSAFFGDFFTNGVLGANTSALKVSAAGDMDISIASGTAYINGRWYRKQSAQVLTVGEPDTLYGRTDAAVIRCDLDKRMIYPFIIEGIPDEVPEKPTHLRNEKCYDIVLAYISIEANCVQITDADITDTRGFDELCGFVTSAIDHIDTSGLFSQYEAQWELLKAACAQDAEAVIAAWDALNTVKSVNKLIPTNGDLTLTQSLIPSDGTAFQFPFYIQSGTVTVDSTAYNGVSVTLPVKYKAAPLVILSGSTFDNGGQKPIVTAYTDVTAQGFKIFAYQISTIPSQLASSGTVNWVTLGALSSVKITAQPEDVSGTIGETKYLKVTATGRGLTYQWQYSQDGGYTWHESTLEGKTTDTLTVPVTAVRNGMQFRCIITAQNGDSITTNAATLTVIPKNPTINAVAGNKEVALSWSASEAATRYRVFYRPVGGDWVVAADITNTTYTVTGLTNGARYEFVVLAGNDTKFATLDASKIITATPA